MTSLATPADILPPTRDIALGENWFPPETHRGQIFRWVENDAVIHVASLDPAQAVLRVVAEPGPGAGSVPLKIKARLSDGTQLPDVVISSKQVITFELPPVSPRLFTVTLGCTGGGKAGFGDPRVLNFRVFQLAVEHRTDVFPAWAKPAKNFYTLESHAGQVFRWVSNDATVELYPVRGAELVFDVESGPGLDSKPFPLQVLTPDGTVVVSAEVGARTAVRVPLKGFEKVSTLTLHAAGGGKTVKSDPRVMNFRIFAPAP